MKKITNAIVIILAIIGLLSCGKFLFDSFYQKETIEIGRFALFEGVYRFEDLQNNELTEHQALYLLDTATGEIKRHYGSVSPNGYSSGEAWIRTEYRETYDKKQD